MPRARILRLQLVELTRSTFFHITFFFEKRDSLDGDLLHICRIDNELPKLGNGTELTESILFDCERLAFDLFVSARNLYRFTMNQPEDMQRIGGSMMLNSLNMVSIVIGKTRVTVFDFTDWSGFDLRKRCLK